MMKVVLLLMALLVLSAGSEAAKKKLIEYGWDLPDTAYPREHIVEMERNAFDGVVFKMNPRGFPGREFGWRAFGRERFDYEHMRPNIEDLKATNFRRFTDNFVQLTVFPGQVDWFDPAWGDIIHNCGLLARAAKEAGCKGIMFDPEAYGQMIWQYNQYKPELKQAHTIEQYAHKIRIRGRQFMDAINKEYPDITLLCLYGPSTGTSLWADQKPEDTHFGLLRHFYQGMLDVATPGTTIVDGWEWWKDPSKKGEGRGFWKAGFSDSKWHPMSIGQFWEEQGEPAYDGCAWYRVTFTPPAVQAGKQMFLVFGAVDEQAWVWLNGKQVGSHDKGPNGWMEPFAVDVTGAIKPGEPNVLAVKVIDTVGAGGIWKSVKVMVK